MISRALVLVLALAACDTRDARYRDVFARHTRTTTPDLLGTWSATHDDVETRWVLTRDWGTFARRCGAIVVGVRVPARTENERITILSAAQHTIGTCHMAAVAGVLSECSDEIAGDCFEHRGRTLAILGKRTVDGRKRLFQLVKVAD